MSAIELKYVDRFRDRHGAMRYYFRRARGRRIPLPGLPGSSEFMAAYEKAVSNIAPVNISEKKRGADGTFDRLVELYYKSTLFSNLGSMTKSDYRRHIDGPDYPDMSSVCHKCLI